MCKSSRTARPLRWLDTEWEILPLVARVASTAHPGLTIALPRLVDRYLQERDRIAELVPLADLARQTAARVADRRGQADAWAALGRALFMLRRYEEAVPVNERALVLLGDLGDHLEAARTGRDLGRALLSLRRVTEAATVLEHSRTLCRKADLPLLEGNVCLSLGHALRHLGHTAEAATAYRDAITRLTHNGQEHALNQAKLALDRLTTDPSGSGPPAPAGERPSPHAGKDH